MKAFFVEVSLVKEENLYATKIKEVAVELFNHMEETGEERAGVVLGDYRYPEVNRERITQDVFETLIRVLRGLDESFTWEVWFPDEKQRDVILVSRE